VLAVLWDASLYVVLVGTEEALGEWRPGAMVLNRSGEQVGALTPVTGEIARLLAPSEAFGGRETVCFQCELSIVELQAGAFSLPRLVGGEIELAPAEERPSHGQQLLADLVARNRIGAFLDGLPDQVGDDQERLTLNFYIRLLNRQGRLTAQDKARLLQLVWLADDLRLALHQSEANE